MVQLAPICVYIEPHYCDPAGESRDGEEALGRRGLVLCDNISGCQRCTIESVSCVLVQQQARYCVVSGQTSVLSKFYRSLLYVHLSSPPSRDKGLHDGPRPIDEERTQLKLCSKAVWKFEEVKPQV